MRIAKLIIIIIILIPAMANANVETTCGTFTQYGPNPPYYAFYYAVPTVYSTMAECEAAKAARWAELEGQDPYQGPYNIDVGFASYCYSGANFSYDWGGVALNYKLTSSSKSVTEFFIYPLAACAVIPPDTDDDGIPDELDPYPNSSDPFDFKVVQYGENTSGEKVWTLIRCSDGQYFEYGDREDVDGYVYTTIGSQTYDSDQLNTLFGEGGSYAGLQVNPSNQIQTVEYLGSDPLTELPEYSSGVDSQSGTDSGKLQDIVSNTKNTVDNQEISNGWLSTISKGIQDLIQAVGFTSGGGGTISGDVTVDGVPSAEEIAEAIGDEDATSPGYGLDDIYNGSSGSDAAYSDAQTAFQTETTLNDIPEDYREKTDLPTEFNNKLSDERITGIRDYIEGHSVSSSGSCSFDWVFKGHTITFSICNFASVLSVFGTLILSITTLNAMIIVFKR